MKIHIEATRKQITGLFVTSLIILALVGGYLIYQGRKTYPEEVKSAKTSFPVYYPASLPDGFVLDKESIQRETGILFYTLRNRDDYITVSQQETPAELPDIANLEGFNLIEGVEGTAVIGSNGLAPTVLYLTDSTLINITSPSMNSSSTLVNLTKNLRKVE